MALSVRHSREKIYNKTDIILKLAFQQKTTLLSLLKFVSEKDTDVLCGHNCSHICWSSLGTFWL